MNYQPLILTAERERERESLNKPIINYVIHSSLGAFAKLRKATTCFVLSVRLSAWNNAASNVWILMKFGI
jgi:hypothetical protein